MGKATVQRKPATRRDGAESEWLFGALRRLHSKIGPKTTHGPLLHRKEADAIAFVDAVAARFDALLAKEKVIENPPAPPAPPPTAKWKVGDFVMSRSGTASLVEKVCEPTPGFPTFGYWLNFVGYYDNGSPPVGGGSGGTYPESELRPVTDPIMLAACRHYAAQARKTAARREQSSAEVDMEKWAGVIEVLHEAKVSQRDGDGVRRGGEA